MKLLDKKVVQTQKANERKKEIDEGVKLAKSVDSLRETYSQEQTRLKKFRDESLAITKADISALLYKKDVIQSELKDLEDRRLKALAPIDLTQEWDRVKTEAKRLENEKLELIERETTLISKESHVIAKESEFFEKEEAIKEKENLTNQYLTEASSKYDSAEKTIQSVQKFKSDTENELKNREELVRNEEVQLSIKERDINLQKEQNLKDIESINKEKIHIASQQQTLKVAWDSIRKLQSNK